MSVFELSQLITESLPPAGSFCINEPKSEQKIDRDEALVKLVQTESIIWQRNHQQFKNVALKEQAWGRIALQLGVTSESCTQTHTTTRIVKSFLISSALFCILFPRPTMCEMTFHANPITNSYICTQETNFPSNSFDAVFVTRNEMSLNAVE
jgi:hypothetical protein